MTIKTTAKLLCIQQLTSMVTAGITLTRALELLACTEKNIALRKALMQIRSDLLAGSTIFNSASKHQILFTNFALQLIHVGEKTGKLNQALKTITHQYQQNLELRNQLIQTLLYPCILLFTAIIMTISMFCFVIPHFAEIFSTIDKPLPLLTKIIFAIGAATQYCCYYVSIIIIIFACMIFIIGKQQETWRTLLKMWRNLPVIKQQYQDIALINFSANLALTLEAGLPLLQSLELAANVANHPEILKTVIKIQTRIKNGILLHQALQACPLFPTVLIQMIKTGEEAGSISVMLKQASEMMRINHRAQLKRLLQLLEPLIILSLGVLIGGLVVGMYLPIFNLGSAL